MLAGVGAFVSLDWSRAGLWVLALAFGAVAFGALGVAIGALAREVRAASLLAFLLSLPLAFLALVPSRLGRPAPSMTRSASCRSCSRTRPRCRPSTQPSTAPRRRSAPRSSHLAALTLAFGALARVGLRRAE